MKRTNQYKVIVSVICVAVLLLCFDMLFAENGFAAAKLKKPHKVKSVRIVSKREGVAELKWRSVECSGYVIKYSQDKSLKKGVTVIKVKKSASKTSISNLGKGKVYYFRVRAFNKKGTKIKYGKLSEKKHVRIHKHVYNYAGKKKIATGKLHTYRCSCGEGYYKTEAKDGRTYDGYLYSFPSCIPGKLQERIGGKTYDLPCTKAHSLYIDASGSYKCRSCGQVMRFIQNETGSNDLTVSEEAESPAEPSSVIFSSPKNTNVASCVAVSVKSAEDRVYDYKVYWQKSSVLKFQYEQYRSYFAMHGCSTCALTTVLNAMVPKYKDYTPDRVLVEVIKPSVGSKAFNSNFSKSLVKQMPIGLKGVNKVLKDSGVKTKYVYNYTKESAVSDIRAHLEKGKPVIFMIRRSTYASNPHMMVMLGLDKQGKVIVGDSSLCSASKWGTGNRLIKFNTKKDKESNTVENICKFFKYSTTSVKGRSYFYDGRKGNIGYILVG